MKNITISISEDTAKWLRVSAAEHELSVSKYVSRMIEEKWQNEAAYVQAKEHFLNKKPKDLKRSGVSYHSKDEIHER